MPTVHATPEGRARADAARKFWFGPLAPIEAMLPAGVDPRRLRTMPALHRRRYVSAVRGEASLRACVTAQCAECCGYDREAVTDCPATACPLWHVRPWRPRGTEMGG